MVELTGAAAADRSKPRQQPFALLANTFGPSFQPELFPERIQVTKERNLDRQQNYCKEEDVNDDGSKNRDIHINGTLTRLSLDDLNEMADSGETYTMVSATWSGDVYIKNLEIEGPTGWWPRQYTMLWEYRLDLVSTGSDEGGDSLSDNGIISEGDL